MTSFHFCVSCNRRVISFLSFNNGTIRFILVLVNKKLKKNCFIITLKPHDGKVTPLSPKPSNVVQPSNARGLKCMKRC